MRQLFEYDEALGKAKFSFGPLVGDINMKKTTLAILDCLINPDFPYVPVQPGEEEEMAWSKIPDLPMRYHVYYRLLDGDVNGRPARTQNVKTGQYEVNPQFDHKTLSGLSFIVNSPFKSDMVLHPVVRLLIQRKWKSYGRRKSRYHIVIIIARLSFLGKTW